MGTPSEGGRHFRLETLSPFSFKIKNGWCYRAIHSSSRILASLPASMTCRGRSHSGTMLRRARPLRDMKRRSGIVFRKAASSLALRNIMELQLFSHKASCLTPRMMPLWRCMKPTGARVHTRTLQVCPRSGERGKILAMKVRKKEHTECNADPQWKILVFLSPSSRLLSSQSRSLNSAQSRKALPAYKLLSPSRWILLFPLQSMAGSLRCW